MAKYTFEIGRKYFIRTVTMIDVGEVCANYDDFVQLKNASWVADTGRFTQAIASGEFNEVEMFPRNAEPIIGKSSIIDAFIVDWELPGKQV